MATNAVRRSHRDGFGIYLGPGAERVAGAGTLGLLRDVGKRDGADLPSVLISLVRYLRSSGGAG